MLKSQVSIICPYRNAVAFLPSLIDNVQSQLYSSWELFLIDDGSIDDAPLFAARAAMSDGRIKPISAPQRPSGLPMGPWWPRNVGLSQAQSDLVAFLDVDDLWHPLKLQRQVAMHLRESADLSVTAYARFKASTRQILSLRVPPGSFGYARLRMSNVIPMLTALVDRRLLLDQFKPCPHEDYLFWLSILRANPDAHCICMPELLAFYSVHEGNLTRARWKMPLWAFQVYRSHGISAINSVISLVPWLIMHTSQSIDANLPTVALTVDQLLSRPSSLLVLPPESRR